MKTALSRADQDRIIEQLASLIDRHYVFEQAARRISGRLRREPPPASAVTGRAGDDRAALAEALTALLRPSDAHFKVRWQADPAQVLAWEAPDAQQNRRRNYGFRQVRILDDNIALLGLSTFCDTDADTQAGAGARAATTAAIEFAANSDALLLDLRDVPGGWGSGANYLLAHLLPAEPVHLVTFIDRAAAPEEAWTPAVSRHLDVPVYVLINGRTASAAECCAYVLQSLGRATVVGQPSAGAANPGERFAMADGFSVFIPTQAPIDPRTGTNWDGTGVQPDRLASGDARQAALEISRPGHQMAASAGRAAPRAARCATGPNRG